MAYNPPKRYRGSCLDGRDITYKIIPDADFKFYITANLKTRALRRYNELKKTCNKFSKLLSECKYVEKDSESQNSLDNILKSRKIPFDFDILSIDIDSFDLEIWESLRNYSPKIVIIEINSGFLPGILKWHQGKPGKRFGGNSFSATLMVAKNKGYQLICHTGNMIFLKKEYINQIHLKDKYITYPELLFDDTLVNDEKEIYFIIKLKNLFKKLIKRL